MIIELCFAISIGMSLYDCDYRIEIITIQEINNQWQAEGGKGWILGVFKPREKLIQITSLTDPNFEAEWRHAFCWNWFVYHMGHNHKTYCQDPHYLIMSKNELAS